MAGILLELEAREVQRALTALALTVGNLRPVMRDIGETILSQAQQSFEDQASPAGDPWEPSQRALDEGGQTLVDQGQLLASLTMDMLPSAVMVGSNKVQAAIHQLGGVTGRGHAVELPARSYLPDEASLDWDEIGYVIGAYLERAVQ